MNTLILNSDPVVRRGLERWENEGGRIRFNTERSNRWNPARDGNGHWRHASPKRSGEAGSGSQSDLAASFLTEKMPAEL